MRINCYLSMKYGIDKKYHGKEFAAGGKKYVRYDSLESLRRDFPNVG